MNSNQNLVSVCLSDCRNSGEQYIRRFGGGDEKYLEYLGGKELKELTFLE